MPAPLAALPTALVALTVAAGTYVRAFARDLGTSLGVPAHLAGLVRTRAGAADLADAIPLEQLDRAPGLPAAQALPLPRIAVDAEQAARLRQGQRLPADALEGEGATALVDADGRLVAIAELAPSGMRLRRVFPRADAPGTLASEGG